MHSDRGGVQVQSLSQTAFRLRMQNQYERKSDCWDNAAMEAFFSRLKIELIYAERFNSISQAKTAIFYYIEIFYKRKRRHSVIGYISHITISK